MEIKTKEEFENFINNEYVLIDFYADWCWHCKMMSPILENISSSRDNIKIAKINVDKQEDIAKFYGVMSIPTLILFKNGQEVDKKIGYTPEVLLNEWINENR